MFEIIGDLHVRASLGVVENLTFDMFFAMSIIDRALEAYSE